MVNPTIQLTTAIPWADPKKTPDPLLTVIANLTARLNFGPGGYYKGTRFGGDAGQAFMRLIVAKALCLDNSMLIMGAEQHGLVKTEIDEIAQSVQDADIFSVFVEGVGGITGISRNDLGSIFFDHVTRDAIRAEVKEEIQFFKPASVVIMTDRWFLRPVPGALFELRFLRWDDHYLVHQTSSATVLNTLIPRIVRNVGVYLHVGSIDRRCLLSPGQEEIVKREREILPDVLGEWASKKFFFMDPEALVAPLSAQVRDEINPSEWYVPIDDRKEEWTLIREQYLRTNISQFSGYSDSLFSIGRFLVKLRESSSTSKIPAPSPLIMDFSADVLATDNVAEFIRSTGAWVEEYVSEGTGSKLNLLTVAERMLSNNPHTDTSGEQNIGYIGYLDRIYDCFARASAHGIYLDTDPQQHVIAILDYFTQLLKNESPEETAKRPFSEVWNRLLKDKSTLPQQKRDARSVHSSSRYDHLVRTFGNLLFYVGGIQKYLTCYFQDRKLPSTEQWGPLDWWRLLLEIEFLLNEYVAQGQQMNRRVPLESFSAKSAVKYFPINSFGASNDRLASAYASWKDGIGDKFPKMLDKVKKKGNPDKSNKDLLILALEVKDWGSATSLLVKELECKLKRELKKESVGEI